MQDKGLICSLKLKKKKSSKMRITTFKSITETYKKTHKKLRAFTIWPNNKNRDNHIDRNICWDESKMLLSSNEKRSR